ncbi:hypothetical protein M413DRAFT_444785 [Hebeloma cylindrosporum]|uniref:DUF6534 domain-containing protein n=1 Tax=Hebeloma cylindrosporum TaxID=76867 RepID=A0A0C3CFG1_HEBCY|nr:hypothetical protein M413DRAFT_444785 [Hebeloma cylindrosporum h7]
MVKPTIENTIGAAFLGVLGSAILLGAIVVQVFTYYTHFKNDWKLQKCFVAWLTLASVLHLAFASNSVYFYVITSFGNFGALEYVVWTFKAQAVLDVATVLTVQGLYAWRVQTLGKHFSSLWPWVVIGIIVIGSVFGIMLVVSTCQTERWDTVQGFHWVLSASFAFATFIDFLIATTLCYYLKRSRSIFTETNNRLLRVMHYVLASGFLTSACSLGALISISTLPKTLVFVGIDFLLPRLYMLSYMTMLNARRASAEIDSSAFNVSGALQHFRSGQNSTWADPTERKPTDTMGTEILSDQVNGNLL